MQSENCSPCSCDTSESSFNSNGCAVFSAPCWTAPWRIQTVQRAKRKTSQCTVTQNSVKNYNRAHLSSGSRAEKKHITVFHSSHVDTKQKVNKTCCWIEWIKARFAVKQSLFWRTTTACLCLTRIKPNISCKPLFIMAAETCVKWEKLNRGCRRLIPSQRLKWITRKLAFFAAIKTPFDSYFDDCVAECVSALSTLSSALPTGREFRQITII